MIAITGHEWSELQLLLNHRYASVRTRAKIVLLSSTGVSDANIAKQLNITIRVVETQLRRWSTNKRATPKERCCLNDSELRNRFTPDIFNR